MERLCATVAGGCGQAEELDELREMLFELAEDLLERGQTLCATVAGGPAGAVEQRSSRNSEWCSSNSWSRSGNSDRRSARP
jgi:type II secretory pathway component PulJ